MHQLIQDGPLKVDAEFQQPVVFVVVGVDDAVLTCADTNQCYEDNTRILSKSILSQELRK